MVVWVLVEHIVSFDIGITVFDSHAALVAHLENTEYADLEKFNDLIEDEDGGCLILSDDQEEFVSVYRKEVQK